jgi:hypothetical protein
LNGYRVSTEEHGNLSALPGSHDWAVAMRREIHVSLHSAVSSADHLSVMVRLMEEHRGYRELEDDLGREFSSFEAFCVCRPPYGLGYRKDDIDRIVRERQQSVEQLAEAATPLSTPGAPAGNTNAARVKELAETAAPVDETGMENKPSNRRIVYGDGQSEYLAARIARDRPDILERMKAGEFPSVRAAAREAGIVKDRITILTEPRAAAAQIRKHFDPESVRELARLLREAANDE